MNYIWPLLILISVAFAVVNGNTLQVGDAVFTSATEAVTLVIKMLGMFCFWSGMMQIAKTSGLTDWISKLLSPVLKRIFPSIQNDSETRNAVSMNITANLLGLGNAATPLGIEAMRRLQARSEKKSLASNDMVLFVVLNTACIRLIPTTAAMLRHEAGAVAPMDILPATLLTSLLSCTIGLIAARAFEGKKYE